MPNMYRADANGQGEKLPAGRLRNAAVTGNLPENRVRWKAFTEALCS
jgi:hypothetical protein